LAKTNLESLDGVCYIATACYGSYEVPEVLILRKFRDKVLLQTITGKLFVKIYYKLSPTLANKLKNMSKINDFVKKWYLDRLVNLIKKTKL